MLHDTSLKTTGVAEPIHAAQYIRMSTEHQQYSPQNQADTIAQYAVSHRMQIVRTYADHGRSGLRVKGRSGLCALLDDVTNSPKSFTALLVYDVSRWGRFQDVDESAYYEYMLKKAGVRIHYCAEQFTNDDSPQSVLFKTLKRTMAAEYSRELSSKVFKAQCRLIELGYRQGGTAGFALTRQLLDKDGRLKTRLACKEYKHLQTDRVVLVPGPKAEVSVVKRIYRDFIRGDKGETQIANDLNVEGLNSPYGKPWAAFNVHEVLVNPKYAGMNVYNRSSFRLKERHVRNPPDMWVRKKDAFEPIVPMKEFLKAQEILEARKNRITDDEMLKGLRELLSSSGRLTHRLIDKAESLPHSQSYTRRFGGLTRAYALIGWTPQRDCHYVDAIHKSRIQRKILIDSIEQHLINSGISFTVCNRRSLLTINNTFRVLIRIARCQQQARGPQWRFRYEHFRSPDIVLVARLNVGDESIMDYYLFPPESVAVDRMRIGLYNPAELEVYRFDDLTLFYSLFNTEPLD